MNEAERAAGLPATAQYQYAERVGNQLFVAGQVPHDSQGHLVGLDDPHAQALQCLSNLNALLAVHGFSTSDVRQLVVYVVGGQAKLSAAWKTVADSFCGQVPPAILLGVAGLGYAGQLDEVHATVLEGIAREDTLWLYAVNERGGITLSRDATRERCSSP